MKVRTNKAQNIGEDEKEQKKLPNNRMCKTKS